MIFSDLFFYDLEYELNTNKRTDANTSNSISDSGCESTDDKSTDVEIDEDDLDAMQSLKNFDLLEYTKLLKELIIWIYFSRRFDFKICF